MQTVRKTMSLVAVGCALLMAVICANATQPSFVDATQIPQRAGPSVDAGGSGPEPTWRYTKFGWQDARYWDTSAPYAPRKTLELIHPFVWAGIVLISVIATMIWASSEWDLDRLFDSR